MYGPGLELQALRQLRRACKRSVNRTFYQGQATKLRVLKQISFSMKAAVPSLRIKNGDILRTIECIEAAGMKPEENICLTLANQKELGRWEDFLRVTVGIITQRNNTLGNLTGMKRPLYHRYYTLLESRPYSGDNDVLYRIVAKNAANSAVAEELGRFYYN